MTGTCSVSPARLDAQSHEVGGLGRDICLMHREADPTSLLSQHLEFDFPVCHAKTPRIRRLSWGDSGMGKGGWWTEREVRVGESSQPKPTAIDQPASE